MNPARTPRIRSSARWGGFTLIELAVVIAIVALLAAVAFPKLMPLIMFSRLEGSAKHVAQFGRAVIGQAALLGEPVTVHVDLDEQQYWATLLVPAKSKEQGSAIVPDQPDAAGDPLAQYKKLQEDKDIDYDNLAQAVGRGITPRDAAKLRNVQGGLSADVSEDELLAQYQAEEIGSELAEKAQRSLRLRAKNVKHENLLDDVGNVFEDAKEIAAKNDFVEQEIQDPLIGRAAVGEDVRLDEVMVGEVGTRRGVVEIPITPLGLEERVVFYFSNADDEEFTALWDPATGATRVYRDRVTRFDD